MVKQGDFVSVLCAISLLLSALLTFATPETNKILANPESGMAVMMLLVDALLLGIYIIFDTLHLIKNRGRGYSPRLLPTLGLGAATVCLVHILGTDILIADEAVDTLLGLHGLPIAIDFVLPSATLIAFLSYIVGIASSDRLIGARARYTPVENDGSEGRRMPAAKRWPAIQPRYRFADIHGQSELKTQLFGAAQEWQTAGRNGVLLHGPAGTGKTMSAEALAGELGLSFMNVTIGDIASKWINDTTERVTALFAAANAQAPVLLFLDEIDSVLREPTGLNNHAEDQRILNTLLTETVALRQKRIFLVAATNFLDRLDPRAIREGRFDFKIEVPLPDAEARRHLIEAALAGSSCTVDRDVLNRVVKRWAGFNVPRIQLVVDRACKAGPGKSLQFDDFYIALRSVQGHRSGPPEGAKPLAEIYLPEAQRQQLADIAMQLSRVDQIERLGGSIPKGLLFYGPPGTGKTATAMALARESGWSFLTYRGRQLLEDGALDGLRAEASDLRPAIIFLDEADDILAHREFSGIKFATNELLSLIDGAGGMLPDVVWIAATNDISSIDAAALRGGRFTQKVEFKAGGRDMAHTIVTNWASERTTRLDRQLKAWVTMATNHLATASPADIFAVLEQANNNAVTRSIQTGEDPAIAELDVINAQTTVMGIAGDRS